MTFQRWARLLIGVIKADDFTVSTVKADSKGACRRERTSRPTYHQLIINRARRKLIKTANVSLSISLESEAQNKPISEIANEVRNYHRYNRAL